MLNSSKIKDTINTHKTAIAAAGGVVVGLSASFVLRRPLTVDEATALLSKPNELLRACEKAGLTLYALDATESAKYLATLAK